MRFRSLEVTLNNRRQAEVNVLAFIKDSREVRELVAKMARSETKNYVAELCEQAGEPLTDDQLRRRAAYLLTAGCSHGA
jgi:hypothetical protein